MEIRADKFLSGHYAYFVELPERKPLEERLEEVPEIKEKKYFVEVGSEYQI
ncbi:MAG: hypothetical protein KKA79_06140 [Nanoarchaeota archaeon]|nr:hypothetical protein [Nanoarchaeota archaeon]MCG2718311.1 hypothetical protein [Nanoarchaeota archaeon]